MIVVTGTAPRCGTSAMMRALLEHYEPHSYAEAFPEYVAKEKNPLGYWDMNKEKLFSADPIPTEECSVIKLWAPQFPRVQAEDIKLLVVMSRGDFDAQVKSIYHCAIAEGLAPPSHELISGMFLNQKNGIDAFFKDVPKIRVEMDTFRDNPNPIISYIKELV